MAGEGRDWKRFQRVKITRKDFSKRAKRAEGATVRHAHKFIVKRWDNIRGVRRHIIAWMVGVALLISAVGVQMMWFQRSYLATSPTAGGTYAEGVTGAIGSLNPLYAVTNAEVAASRLMFSSLYSYDTTGHLKGDLATKMTEDASGKVYTVTLRPDAKWHDGYDVTAKDIVFTVNLMKNSSTRATNREARYSSWKDIDATAISDRTVAFTLPASYASFPQALTFSVLPEHLLKEVNPSAMRESSYSTSPVGSGPFQFSLLQQIGNEEGRKIVHLSGNTDYYRGAPKLDRMQLHAYTTNEKVASALRTGEISAAAEVSGDTARAVDQNRYDISVKSINSGVYAIFNTSQPILKDTGVRKALQLGLNTSELRKKIYGNPQQLDLPFVTGQLSGEGIPTAAAFDQNRAKELLEADGWIENSEGVRQKAGEDLRLRIVTRKSVEFERALESIVGQWRALGVQVDSQIVDPSEVGQSFAQAVLKERNYDVLLDELLIGADPDVFAYWHTQGFLNLANYSNSVSDDALASARTRSEPELRNVKYKAFAKQWLDDVPAVGLYQSNMLYVRSKTAQSLARDEKIISAADRYANVINWTADNTVVYKTP